MKEEISIEGFVAPGFEEVYYQFRRNFEERNELGAALAVYRQGQLIIDLWGGYRDGTSHSRWEKDTMAMVFSGSKGMVALALALAHSKGYFAYDDPIARYWPAFAQHGKENITIRQLLDHQAGLAVIDQTLSPALLADHDELAKVLAAQKPAWEPGQRNGYHAVSQGLYLNELLRRTDPQHRTLRQFFNEELAQPLSLDFYIGLPEGALAERRAALEYFSFPGEAKEVSSLPAKFNLEMLWPWSLPHEALRNPPVVSLPEFNQPPYLHLEIPSVNGIGTARSIARLYGEFASGAKQLGVKENTLQALAAMPSSTAGEKEDLVLKTETCFSLGCWKPCHEFWFGSDDQAYGAPGVGGALGFADPAIQLGYAYTPNRLGLRFWNHPRELALRNALYGCLESLR